MTAFVVDIRWRRVWLYDPAKPLINRFGRKNGDRLGGGATAWRFGDVVRQVTGCMDRNVMGLRHGSHGRNGRYPFMNP